MQTTETTYEDQPVQKEVCDQEYDTYEERYKTKCTYKTVLRAAAGHQDDLHHRWNRRRKGQIHESRRPIRIRGGCRVREVAARLSRRLSP
jgi:hypothetical protein